MSIKFPHELRVTLATIEYGRVAPKISELLPDKDTAVSILFRVALVEEDMGTSLHIPNLVSIPELWAEPLFTEILAGRNAGDIHLIILPRVFKGDSKGVKVVIQENPEGAVVVRGYPFKGHLVHH